MAIGGLGGHGEVLSSARWRCQSRRGVVRLEVVPGGELLDALRPLVVCKFVVERRRRQRWQAVDGVRSGGGGVQRGVRWRCRSRGSVLCLGVAFQEEALRLERC